MILPAARCFRCNQDSKRNQFLFGWRVVIPAFEHIALAICSCFSPQERIRPNLLLLWYRLKFPVLQGKAVGDNQDNHKVELGKKSLENQRRQTGQDDFQFVGVPRCFPLGKTLVMSIVMKQQLTTIATSHDMVNCAGEFHAWFSGQNRLQLKHS